MYQPEKTINILDQIRTNLLRKGLDPKLAFFYARKWGVKRN